MNKKQIILLGIGIFALSAFASSNLNIIYAQSDSNSTFYLIAKINPNASTTNEPELEISKLEIDNKQICPSGQCKIHHNIDKDSYFSGPDIPKSTLIGANFEFSVQDDIGHADLGPKKKALVEQYRMDINCDVFDIDEDNGKELYWCHPHTLGILGGNIYNSFTKESWRLSVYGTFDAKSNILSVHGIIADKEIV